MVTEDIARLWAAYAKTRTVELRNQLVEAHWGLVEEVVARFERMPPRGYDPHRVQTAADQAIVAAVEQYDPGRGALRALFKLIFERRLADLKRNEALERRQTVQCEHATNVTPSRTDFAAWIDEVASGPWSREILTRYLVECQTLREIAAALGIPRREARAEVHRVMEQVAETNYTGSGHAS